MTALQTLHDKVEAGEATRFNSEFQRAFYPITKNMDQVYQAGEAYLGDLNAAKALHDAVLPGWEWSSGSWGASIWQKHKPPGNGEHVELSDLPDGFTSARAWLLAVLRAKINEGE